MKSLLQKKWPVCLISVVVILGIVAVVFTVSRPNKANADEVASKESNVMKGNLTVGVTETGPVSIGALTQSFDIDVNGNANTANMGDDANAPSSGSDTPTLVVEEVYAKVGKVVEQGEPVLRLTSESVKETTGYLEDVVEEAKASLKEAKIQRDVKKLQARSEYDSNVSLGKIAKTEYDTTLKSLSAAVTKAQKELKEAKARISKIPSEVKELKKKKSASTKEEEKQSIQNEIDTLQKELETYQNNYGSLKANVSEAKSNQTSGKISAKKKYEEAVVNYENAKELYDVAIEGVDNEVNAAKEALEDAKDDLAEFKQWVGDGTITAAYGGTVTSLGYQEGGVLSTSTAIATYTDSSAVSVTVSVSEEDVSAIQIGNRATIAFTAYPEETYEGEVTSIAASESDSSTVSYDVAVDVAGDVGKLYEGMTGNVTFVTKEVKDVLYVSNKAVMLDGTKSYVLKKDGGQSVRVEVATGFSDGVNVEIKEGLKEGDVVLISIGD